MGTLVEVDLRWMDCVKNDIRINGVSMEMTSNRREWKTKWDKGMMVMMIASASSEVI
jgi:hypothetical protein